MTTVGVASYGRGRVDPMRFPSYNYHYPHFRRRQEEEACRAAMATPPPYFRRVDMEMKRRLCEEMRRQNYAFGAEIEQTGCTPALRGVEPRATPIQPHPDSVRERTQQKRDYFFDTTPFVTTNTRRDWNYFLSRCPERYDINLPLPRNGGEVNYELRFLRPFMTRQAGQEPDNRTLLGGMSGMPGPTVPSGHRNHRARPHLDTTLCTNGRTTMVNNVNPFLLR